MVDIALFPTLRMNNYVGLGTNKLTHNNTNNLFVAKDAARYKKITRFLLNQPVSQLSFSIVGICLLPHACPFYERRNKSDDTP